MESKVFQVPTMVAEAVRSGVLQKMKEGESFEDRGTRRCRRVCVEDGTRRGNREARTFVSARNPVG